jgi:HD-GYP domain-containing protein (c-di-GMP phosphodiesterase class II)
MKILLVRSERESAEILSFILESKLRADVTVVSSAQKGVDSFLTTGAFDLIVIDLVDYPKEKVAENPIFAFLQNCGAVIPIIALASKPFPSLNKSKHPNLLGFVDRANIAEELLPVIQFWITEGTIYLGQDELDFCQIKTELLLKISPLLTDVFVRLSDNHFVKFFTRGHQFTLENFERLYFEKNIQYLFVKKEACSEIIDKLLVDLARLIDAENTPMSLLRNLTLSTHEMVIELTSKLGFTPEVQKLARENVRLVLKVIGRNPKISNALAKINSASGRYLSDQCLISAHVACAIASLLDWSSETTFQKLAFAAMFHDLSLAGTRIARLNVSESLDTLKPLLTSEEFMFFKDHPNKTAAMIRTFEGIPPDVDIIVEQHHEEPYGTGFPHGLTAMNLSPLSCVFIVAHDVVNFTLRTGVENFSLENFLKLNTAKYSSGHFKQIAKVLHERKF